MARDDRTEQPTPERRKRAREKGQVARSPDLSGSLVVVAGLLALSVSGPRIVGAAGSAFREIYAEISHPAEATSAAGLNGLMHVALSTFVAAVAPVAIACLLAALFIGVAQVGFSPSLQTLKPDLRRINPISGTRNLLSVNLIFEAFKASAKIAVVGAIAALAIVPGLTGLASLVGIPPAALGVMLGQQALGVAQRVAFAYVLIGVLDYGWRRWRHEQQLKMTKQQLKDEMRQYGLPAEVKSALRRQKMKQMAKRRMQAAVAEVGRGRRQPDALRGRAALRREEARRARIVVAKGIDEAAAKIREVARKHGVPVLSGRRSPARCTSSSTRTGRIPSNLYKAVAEVLAFVYRIGHRSAS